MAYDVDRLSRRSVFPHPVFAGLVVHGRNEAGEHRRIVLEGTGPELRKLEEDALAELYAAGFNSRWQRNLHHVYCKCVECVAAQRTWGEQREIRRNVALSATDSRPTVTKRAIARIGGLVVMALSCKHTLEFVGPQMPLFAKQAQRGQWALDMQKFLDTLPKLGEHVDCSRCSASIAGTETEVQIVADGGTQTIEL